MPPMVITTIIVALMSVVGVVAQWQTPASAKSIPRVLAVATAQPPTAAGPRDPHIIFERDIQPIFARRCNNCHVGEKVKSGFSLASREDVLRGGDSGEPSVVPGNAADSRLFKLVAGLDPDALMPPKGAALTKEQTQLIKDWIDQGAAWGDGNAADPANAGDADRKRSWHWSYQAVVRPAPPIPTTPSPTSDVSWANSPIDSFVLSKLEQEGLAPAPEADRATLIRRLSLDLIGLPPTPEDVDAFIADASPAAYERVVDRLLASPRYGEHWARFWLDLARYADSHGYEKDGLRVMWPYRDWVIDAFNRDLPYDQFTIDQLAGDLLPNPTLKQLVATGFHRNTQINEEGGTDPEEFRVEAVLDRVNTTASVWLGTTLACAQCHDHKYDPISQREYFEMYAFFNQDAEDATIVNATATEKRAGGPMIAVPAWPDYEAFEQASRERIVARAAFVRAAPSLVVMNTESPRSFAAARDLHEVEARLKSLTAAQALVMGRAPAPRESHVFIRGSFLAPGEPVTPGVPAVLRNVAGTPSSGDRLGLARWIVDPANPLTARIHVNRVWARLFGRGLVETEDDFGIQGDEPANRELLDWLASEFVRNGWSQKQLLKTIVSSATYRQSSRVSSEALERDPYNKLLSRGARHRVDAETVRDVALAASGLLSSKMYGSSVFPPQPPGIWTQIYSGDRWSESQGEDRYRRGVYTFARRTSPYPTFVGFDAPSREVLCSRRPRTNTPLQALTTLNDPQFIEAAGALAVRMMREGGSEVRSRLSRGVRLTLGRPAEAAELDRLEALYRSSVETFGANAAEAGALLKSAMVTPRGGESRELAAMVVVANVLLNLDEAITRE